MKTTMLSVLFCAAAATAFAQDSPMNMGGADAKNMPSFAQENMQAMDRMHGPMMDAMKASNADEAFVKGMIPHHQGAIDMANVALKYGKDPQVRKWAQKVIRNQGKEKVEFQAWIKKHGG
jgi:uncharacterized protein (DUF305 family)